MYETRRSVVVVVLKSTAQYESEEYKRESGDPQEHNSYCSLSSCILFWTAPDTTMVYYMFSNSVKNRGKHS